MVATLNNSAATRTRGRSETRRNVLDEESLSNPAIRQWLRAPQARKKDDPPQVPPQRSPGLLQQPGHTQRRRPQLRHLPIGLARQAFQRQCCASALQSENPPRKSAE